MSKQWFIPNNVPSLKNSKVRTKNGRIVSSKYVNKYLQLLGIASYSASRKELFDYKTRPNQFKAILETFPKFKESDYPIKIGFHFIRKTKAKFDFNNANQLILDLLTAGDYIIDDNMDYILPFPLEIDGKYYSVDKNNPGVIITIL